MVNDTDLKSGPGPGEGEITSVDFERAGRTSQQVPAASQNCGGDVPRDVEHIAATIWVPTSQKMRAEQRLAMAYFCSRECWSSWATADG